VRQRRNLPAAGSGRLLPFCGDALVAQPKAADPLVAPDAVLPASITKDKAQTEVRAWLQTRWFAPNALKRLARQEAISGVYLPFWDYDADTTTQYSGQRGEQYYETESYTDADGNTQTRQVMRTSWYPASGVVSRRFENVLVPASRSVSESKLSVLEPWGLDTLRPYEPAFLAGFKDTSWTSVPALKRQAMLCARRSNTTCAATSAATSRASAP
jgi:hypothetical protein